MGPFVPCSWRAGARLVDVPVDLGGIVVDAIRSNASIVCVTPAHQFPLGVTMSPAQRLSRLEFARRANAVVIEDDYDGEFRFDGRPLDALKTLDRDARVMYVRTFSKSLFSALRIGYIVAPPFGCAAHWLPPRNYSTGMFRHALRILSPPLLARDTWAATFEK